MEYRRVGQGQEKIAKACEACRRRKTRCNGEVPCHHCQRKPSDCVYRARARVRKPTMRQTPDELSRIELQQASGVVATHTPAGDPTQAEPETDVARQKVYHSVMATHGPEFACNSQLFYGPSSNFAFLQQVHRSILASHGQPLEHEVQEGGPGLDTFMQRTIFFGTASRVDATPSHQIQPLHDVSLEQAKVFLNQFKLVSYHLYPFFTESELENLLCDLYTNDADVHVVPQKRVTILAILANGAISTVHTHLAEMLFNNAKEEAAILDDAVTLTMIQLSILLAGYQAQMGRLNSTYLHLGVACRKAFAMGLHKQNAHALTREEDLQNRRNTLWSLYFHERYF